MAASGAPGAHPADGEQARPVGGRRGGDLVGALAGGLVVPEFGRQRRGGVQGHLVLILRAGRGRVRLRVGLRGIAVGLAGVGVVYTEYKSVRENLTAIRSAAVKMTTLVELLANAHDPKEITGLLLKYNEVKDSADKGKARRDQLNTLLNLTQNENID